jgi:hypothetical protein
VVNAISSKVCIAVPEQQESAETRRQKGMSAISKAWRRFSLPRAHRTAISTV